MKKMILALLFLLTAVPVVAGIEQSRVDKIYGELEWLAQDADRVQLYANLFANLLVAPLGNAGAPCVAEITVPVLITTMKNINMALNAALERDKSLLVAASDGFSDIITLEAKYEQSDKNPVRFHTAEKRETPFELLLTTMLSNIASAAVLNKMAAVLKEKYPSKDEQAKRRVLRVVTYVVTSLVMHVAQSLVLTSLRTSKPLNKAGWFVNLHRLAMNNLTGALNFILAEIEGHYLVQLIESATEKNANTQESIS